MAVAIEYKVLAGMNEVANKLPSIIKERNVQKRRKRIYRTINKKST